jgi:penicillin amidase
MLDARTVAELHETQRRWVDPVNNLVSADVEGNIGYLTRGEIPVRSSQAHRQFPAPGWTGDHEWTGSVPFEQLPQAINPPEGFIATANQKVTPHEEPYIAHNFAVPSRAERLVELLSGDDKRSPEAIMAMQGDVQSVPARSWAGLMRRCGPFGGDTERARAMLAAWDGNLLPESGAALLYAYARRAITRALFEPVVGEQTWTWLMGGEPAALGRMVGQWLANVIATLDDGSPTTPDGRAWNDLLPDALASAWQATVAKAGADPAAWRWVEHHGTNAKHTLATAFPESADSLNPPRAFVGGDSDTIQCAGYGWSGRADFDITSLSVYRQAVDLTDIDHGSDVIPGGVSGLPGTPHYADQLDLWRTHQRIPMDYAADEVEANARQTLHLTPV